jgi:GNAT superfamily N-acetyltransferase
MKKKIRGVYDEKGGKTVKAGRGRGRTKACGGNATLTPVLQCSRGMYIDDLVTNSDDRSHGFGKLLFDWLVAAARERGCAVLALDSGVQRFGAHRFYLVNRMSIMSHHFTLRL